MIFEVGFAVGIVVLLVMRRRLVGSRRWPTRVAASRELRRAEDHVEDFRLGQIVLVRLLGWHTASTRRVDSITFHDGRLRRTVSIDTVIFPFERTAHQDAGQQRQWGILPIGLGAKRKYPGDQRMLRTLDVRDSRGGSLSLLGHYDNAAASWSALAALYAAVRPVPSAAEKEDGREMVASGEALSSIERDVLWRVAAWSRVGAVPIVEGLDELSKAHPGDGRWRADGPAAALLAEFGRGPLDDLVAAYRASKPLRAVLWLLATNYFIIVELPDRPEDRRGGPAGSAAEREIVKLSFAEDGGDLDAAVASIRSEIKGSPTWRSRIRVVIRSFTSGFLGAMGIIPRRITAEITIPVGRPSLHVNVQAPANVEVVSLALWANDEGRETEVAVDNRLSRWPGVGHVHVESASPTATYSMIARLRDERRSQTVAATIAATGLASALYALRQWPGLIDGADDRFISLLLVVPALLAGSSLVRPVNTFIAGLTAARRAFAGLVVLLSIASSAVFIGEDARRREVDGIEDISALLDGYPGVAMRVSAGLAIILGLTLIGPLVYTWLVRVGHRRRAAQASVRGRADEPNREPPSRRPPEAGDPVAHRDEPRAGERVTSGNRERRARWSDASFELARRCGPLARVPLALTWPLHRMAANAADEGDDHADLYALREAMARGALLGVTREMDRLAELLASQDPARVDAVRAARLCAGRAVSRDARWVHAARGLEFRPDLDGYPAVMHGLACTLDIFLPAQADVQRVGSLGVAGAAAVRITRRARFAWFGHPVLNLLLRLHLYSAQALAAVEDGVAARSGSGG